MEIFNPEHDLCMANGDANFVPPASALEFGRDCAGLTAWIDESAENEVIPWGWDAVLKRRLQKDGVPEAMLPSDGKIEEIRRLSHRRTALLAGVRVHECLKSRPELESLLRPVSYVEEICDAGEVSAAVDRFGDAVLKSPLSGSGKGLRWARSGELSASDMGWCRNVIARQGSVMVEKRLHIVRDFAMLFHVGARNGGKPMPHTEKAVSFEGYSLFFNDNGTYRGNVLASDAKILSMLTESVPEELLLGVKESLTGFIEDEFAGHYAGYVGVDMCIYMEPGGELRLAPSVEMNVRMTMGLLARRLFDNRLYVSGNAILLLRPGEETPSSGSIPIKELPELDGRYTMSVEYCPAPGSLHMRRAEFLAALTEITPSSRYAVVVV